MEKPRFMMTVGLAGSGKSKTSKDLISSRNDIVYLSSDLIRLELFGDAEIQRNHGEVFNLMTKRSIDALKNGHHVIFDATNINRRRRKGLLRQLPENTRKIALYISTEYKEVLKQNKNRDRVVPEKVIEKMYKNMHVPIYNEGWDEIVFSHHDLSSEGKMPVLITESIKLAVSLGIEGYEVMNLLASHFEEFLGIYDLPQDSKYHSFSVSRHTYHVYKYVLENWDEDDPDKNVMLWTALLHDIGKSFCKSFINRKGEKTRYANFIGHENVGSQIAIHFLHKMNFDDDFIHKVTTLIQFHMYLLDENANKNKLMDYVGRKNYMKLEFLREADTLAH